jgi:predicted nucleotidyltransferase component of viral defense system
MRIAESVKARLKNRAENENRTFQEILTVYGLERALYRLSISPFSNQFILKGGILLYALFQGNFTRGTADVDFLGDQIANDLVEIRNAFHLIFTLQCPEDGLVFDVSTLKAERISEFSKYPGIHVSIEGDLERSKLYVNIDIGFGDVIYPKKIAMEYPTLLDHLAPVIQAYSMESVIAEKFEAIVSLGKANSRMKDFYDIFALSKSFDFDGRVLAIAISDTFANRKTKLETIVAFENGFSSNPYRKGMWTSFLKSKKILSKWEFDTVIQDLIRFLLPLVEAINKGSMESITWNHVKSDWIS